VSNHIPAPGRSDPVSHEVRPRRVLYAEQPATHWVRRVVSPGAVSISETIDLFCSTVPSKSFKISSSSSHAFASSELLRFISSLIAFRHELHLPGFSALFATSPERSHLTATTPTPSLRSVPRLSQPFDVLLRAPACRLISSRSHVQGPTRPGASLPAQPPFLFGRSCPQAVAPSRADRLSPAAARAGPRLRGLHPRETAFDTAQLFTALHAAPLLGFVSSRLALHSVDRILLAISAHDVSLAAPSLSRSRFELVLSVSPERSLVSRLRFTRLLELSSLPPNLRARDPNSPPVALR
jgi:hypothetical protein